MQYSALIQQYFNSPNHMGEFSRDEKNIGVAMLGTAEKGDVVQLQIKCNTTGVIEIALFKAQASVVTTALCSWLTSQLYGKTLEQAKQITAQQMAAEFNLPVTKMHCALLAEQVLQTVISDYQNKMGDALCTVRS